MQTSYGGGAIYYFLHAFPIALVWGLLFFLLGVIVGGVLWRSRRAQAKYVEQAIRSLEEEHARLKESVTDK